MTSYYNPVDEKCLGVKPYSKGIAIAMTINYIVGTGCFGLPFAFTQSGMLLTTIFLIFGSVIATIAMSYTLESMARAEGVTAIHEAKVLEYVPEDFEEKSRGPQHCLTYRKFDFAMIANVFLGFRGKLFVQICLGLYSLGALWSYASVFASSIASISINYVYGETCDVFLNPSVSCMDAYYISMAGYAVVVITLVLMDLGDQAGIQNFLAVYRFVAFGLMLATLSIKVFYDWNLLAGRVALIGLMNWDKFGNGFGPAILAINCHYNMPDAIQPLRTKDDAKNVTYFALGISSIAYLTLGILGALCFDEVNPLTTLNWVNYSGCGNGWGICTSKTSQIFGEMIRLLILLFPAVNVLSTYPMVGLTIGENLLSSVPKHVKLQFGELWCRKACRIIVVTPPLVLASFFLKLDLVFTVSGLFGFLLALTIPVGDATQFIIANVYSVYFKYSVKIIAKSFGVKAVTLLS